MDRLGIREYINGYAFEQDIQMENNKFIKRPEVIRNVEQNGNANFADFAKVFWHNPNIGIAKLKKEFSIPNSISYSNIIKTQINDTYILFLKKVWDDVTPIENLIQEFGITYKAMNDIVFPIFYVKRDIFCPCCYSNGIFWISGTIEEIKANNYKINCYKCYHEVDEFITCEQAEREIQEHNQKQTILEDQVRIAKQQIEEIKCPKCQSDKLILLEDTTNYKYRIHCQKCKRYWDKVEDIIYDYQEWQRRAAMMISIKEKEKALIKKALENKRPLDLVIRNQDNIKDEEYRNAIVYAIENKDNPETYWNSLFKYIKTSSRTEKLLLIKIIELCSMDDKNTSWSMQKTKQHVELKRFTSEEPIVSILYDHTKILNIRVPLRLLMKANVIACSEESNFIDISPVIINNLERIQSILKPHNLSNDIKYLVLKRENYSCYNCGETGRPLKIAYLSTDKNISNLDKLTAVCDLCFDDVTENEVLIDGTVTNIKEDSAGKENITWEFVTSFLPELKGNSNAYKSHTELIDKFSEEFDESNILKALAISLNKTKSNNRPINSMNGFYRYTEVVLNNSSQGKVYPSKAVENEFNLTDWIKLIK